MQEIKGRYVDIDARQIYGAVLTINAAGRIERIQRDPERDHRGWYILPGFVDAHVHIESSMLLPVEFAKLAAVHGTVATVSDPHEIANIMGLEGIEYMLDNARHTPLSINFGAPSCVPATRAETAGATLDSKGVATPPRPPGHPLPQRGHELPRRTPKRPRGDGQNRRRPRRR